MRFFWLALLTLVVAVIAPPGAKAAITTEDAVNCAAATVALTAPTGVMEVAYVDVCEVGASVALATTSAWSFADSEVAVAPTMVMKKPINVLASGTITRQQPTYSEVALAAHEIVGGGTA